MGPPDQGERRLAILAALKTGPKSRREIETISGFLRNGLRRHLESLIEDGVIVRIDESLNKTIYRLATGDDISAILDRGRLPPGKRAEQILGLLKEPISATQIAKALPLSGMARNRQLKKLRSAGKVTLVRGGKPTYGLYLPTSAE
ncbi:MAG: ArsR family transcriptional regulator [Rhodospirillaceae bacterium]